MDNMLYIIAGLVLILLVAGFLLRKNKAQKQSAPPPASLGRSTAATTSTVDHGTPVQSAQTDSNKFDHITIAQRFIDQQRYDKAIETINRGLSEKPNDSQLSLKLLGLYATLDQPENFNNVYDTIKAHNDAKTITLANELKDLYVGEPSPVATPEIVADDTHDKFDSLDFDLSTAEQNNDTATESNTSSVEDGLAIEENDNTVTADSIDSPVLSNEFDNVSSNIEDSFDLTLSDLEDNEPEVAVESPVTPLSLPDDECSVSTDNSVDTLTDDVTEDNDLSDFEFDFDTPAQDLSAERSGALDVKENESDALELEDEFILDFDDLAADTDKDSAVTDDIEDTSISDDQNISDDFTLSLDSLDASDKNNTLDASELSSLKESSEIDDFILEDTDFESPASDRSTLEDSGMSEFNFEDQLISDDSEVVHLEESDIAPAAPLRFDDDTMIDDDFDIADTDSVSDSQAPASFISTTAPVEFEVNGAPEAAESAEDFSSRFAADFDFVKSLDSNQVTLDLANQYLQLGEYDSAKRLLNEVIAQGNSEQKQQAQVLLERTA